MNRCTSPEAYCLTALGPFTSAITTGQSLGVLPLLTSPNQPGVWAQTLAVIDGYPLSNPAQYSRIGLTGDFNSGPSTGIYMDDLVLVKFLDGIFPDAVSCGTQLFAFDPIQPCLNQFGSFNYTNTMLQIGSDIEISANWSSSPLYTGNGFTSPIAGQSTLLNPVVNPSVSTVFTLDLQIVVMNSTVFQHTYTITVNPNSGTGLLQTPITSSAVGFCPNISSSMVLTANGSGGNSPYSYLWNNSTPGSTLSITSPGTYSVLVTDDVGCTATSSITVNNYTTLQATLNTSPAPSVCQSGASSTITATVTAGDGPYTYLWSANNATTNSIVVTTPATYTVTITDDNGCSYQFNQTIGSFSQVNASITSSSGSFNFCSGTAGINLNAIPSSGTSPFTYLWSSNATTSSIPVTVAGTYTVTITDANGCTAITSQQVSVLPIPQFTVGTTPNSHLCLPTTSPITLTPSAITGGVSGPYTYLWNNGIPASTINVLLAGTYTVTISSSNGCSNAVATVITSSTPSAAFTGPNVACDPTPTYTCPITYPTYNWTVTGGTFTQSNPSINVTWTNSTLSGVITLQVIDQFGCTANSTVNVSGCCSTFTTLINPESAALGAGITNTDFSINGDFIINQDFVIAGCNLEMGANARIIVEDGFALTITSANDVSHLYACQDMWQGIVLEGNGSSLIIDNATLIEDAIIAVYSNHSPSIDISRSFFLNNFIGVQLENHNSVNNVIIVGNEFHTTNLNRVPHVGHFSDAHIKLIDVKNILIGGTSNGNEFLGRCDFGIYAAGAEFGAVANTFSNYSTNKKSSGIYAESSSDYVASDNIFDGVNIGCYSSNSTDAEIGPNNEFNNLRDGIIAFNCLYKTLNYFQNDFDNIKGFGIFNGYNWFSTQTITDNSFTNGVGNATAIGVHEFVAPTSKMGTFNIEGNIITDYVAGIDLSNLNTPQVKGWNDITLSTPVNSSFIKIGISVKNCYRPIVKYNNVTSIPTSPATYIGSSRGILINKSDQSFVACNTVSNVERGIMWENLSASSKMLGNDMTNCYDHLYLRNNPGLGYQYATISVSGVKTDVPSDNTWQWPILNSHTNSEVSNFPIGTTFEVRSNFSPYVGAVNSLIGGTPFDIVYFSPESYSGADFCASLSANKVDFDQEQLIAENIVYDYIESENENWQSKLYLYRELLKDTALLNSDTIMMNQKDSLESTNLAALDLVATSLFSIITDTVLSDEQKDSALIELAVINSEIEAGILVEDLEQQMNNFIIEKMSRDSIGISEEDRDFLESIALNCTQKGGNAVFVAWSLLTLLDSTNNSYNDSCSQEESRIRDTDENVNKHVEIMIQPNPADNFILISIIGESVNHNFDFEIKNIDGKLVERNSSVNAQQITLNTAKYASGIYTLKVSIEGRTLTSKFIITH